MNPNVLIVGLGGIGSNLLELVVPALNRCDLNTIITIMDDDVVDYSNLGHQRFSVNDVDSTKVSVLSGRFGLLDNVSILPIEEKLTHLSQLDGYDLIIVAVDRMEPRQLVHNSDVEWLDLRCQGDGYIVIDNLTSPELVKSIPSNQVATSCQIEGAIEHQNIEFGFSMCATIGAQWLLQKIRQFHGHKSNTPNFRMGSITSGELGFKAVID